jgi:hypothetical protein
MLKLISASAVVGSLLKNMNCSSFEARHKFGTYVQALLNASDGDLSQLQPCSSQICTALWGQGNADISGIGVSNLMVGRQMYTARLINLP